jgi:hypothetical protein
MILTILKVVAGAAVLFMISMILVAVVSGLKASAGALNRDRGTHGKS